MLGSGGGDGNGSGGDGCSGGNDSIPLALAPAPLPTPRAPYLAQYDLLAQLPALARDVCEPEYCVLGQDADDEEEEAGADVEQREETDEEEVSDQAGAAAEPVASGSRSARAPPPAPYHRPPEPLVRAWLGPAHTVSDAHTDPHDNLLCQVVGCKFVRLVSPEASHCMYPRPPPLTNTSFVDVGRPDAEAHPLYVQLRPWALPPPPPPRHSAAGAGAADGRRPLVQDVVLRPGEMCVALLLQGWCLALDTSRSPHNHPCNPRLFIPRGWWHYVRSLTTSFSVSYWF